jgi:hypothetical protein
MKKGSALKVRDIQQFIMESKNDTYNDFGDWIVDQDLSTEYVQVYKNKYTNQAVVMHRGSNDVHDFIVDIGLLVNHKKGHRFDSSKQIQQLAEEKYGPKNITTLGYSLGGLLAELYGQNSKEIITFNKVTLPYDIDKVIPNNQYDIRTKRDIVSILKHFNEHKNDITIPSSSYNIIDEHYSHNLDKLDPERLVGEGLLKSYTKCELKLLIKKLALEKGKRVRVSGLNKMDLMKLYKRLLKN